MLENHWQDPGRSDRRRIPPGLNGQIAAKDPLDLPSPAREKHRVGESGWHWETVLKDRLCIIWWARYPQHESKKRAGSAQDLRRVPLGTSKQKHQFKYLKCGQDIRPQRWIDFAEWAQHAARAHCSWQPYQLNKGWTPVYGDFPRADGLSSQRDQKHEQNASFLTLIWNLKRCEEQRN